MSLFYVGMANERSTVEQLLSHQPKAQTLSPATPASTNCYTDVYNMSIQYLSVYVCVIDAHPLNYDLY
jgi:hypothetical protein